MAAFPARSLVVGPHSFAYEALFKQADVKGKGVVSAAQAANFLKQSGLKESVLSQIWELSDPLGKGFLDKHSFFVALKLIAVVQNGKEASIANIGLPVPLPNMGAASAPSTNKTANDSSGPAWSIPASEKIKYDQIFDSLHPVNGLLPGDKVKPVLLNSKLPVDVLGQVWDLSDIDGDGSLDRDEFAVAMHLVYKALLKVPVPSALSTDLIPPSKRSKRTTSTSDTSPNGKLPPSASTPVTAAPPVKWIVTSQAKAQYDELFTKTDTDQDGFVNGAEIKGVFLKSGLPQSVLAKIWSLCDTRGLGKLNRDQFALAMYLIQQKLKGIEPPAKLTPEMIPPSARRRSLVDGVVPAGLIVDYNTPGMKELETLGNDIEKLKLDKSKTEQEKVAVDAEVKAKDAEFQTLQQEMEVVLNAVKQLNTQKIEAQKRLDELENRKNQLEKALKSQEQLYEEEQRQIVELKNQLTNQDNQDKTMEESLKAKRDELNQLRHQELELELKAESGHNKLVQLAKLVHSSQVQINQAEYNIGKLEEAQRNIMQSINLYDSMLNNEISEEEAMKLGSLAVTSPLALDLSLSTLDAMSDIVQMTSEELEDLQNKLTTLPSGDDEDMYEAELDNVDKSSDMIEQESQETPNEKVEEEPWTDVAFARPPARNDPFAIGFVTELKSPVNPEDPFGQGAFAPPGARPARPSRPPAPKSPNPKPSAPPGRPKSPLPPRPKSPAPPQRPKSPLPKQKATPPSRPPAPLKSPMSAPDSAFPNGSSSDTSFADFTSDKFSSEYDLQ